MPGNIFVSVSDSPGNVVDITLCGDTVEELFDEAFDGWCPICRSCEINVGEIICCECLAEAYKWHDGHCDWQSCRLHLQRR